MVQVDLRTITLNVPPQEVITKDNVPVRVNAVAYFRIVDPSAAIVQVENFMVATSQIAQTTLRSVLGQHLLDELLSERDKINAILQQIIDEATAPWGIKVSIVEVKDVEIPAGMQRAMARQAEAERERRAKVIAAEGEFQASERLKDAAIVMAEAPMALQLRYLQTLLELGASASTTIVFPAPIDLIRPFLERGGGPELSGELRVDPLTGRQVVIAPGRAKRPGAGWPHVEPATAGGARGCPFCAGARIARRRRRSRSATRGASASCRTSTRPSSARRSSSTRPSTCGRSPSSTTTSSRSSPRPGASAAASPPATCTRSSTRARGRRQPRALALAARLAGEPPAVARARRASRCARAASRVLERDGVVAACSYAPRLPYEPLIAPRARGRGLVERPARAALACSRTLAACTRSAGRRPAERVAPPGRAAGTSRSSRG